MDTLLISVTLVSLGLAGAMGVLVVKLLRDERKRSDARVAALVELSSEDAGRAPARATVPTGPAARGILVRPSTEVAPPERRVRQERALDDLEIRPSSARPTADLFVEPGRESPWGRRVAIIGLLAALGSGAVALLTVDGDDASSTTTAVASASAVPLELVSLRHTHDGGTLTIAGLVQNPRTGAPRARITVTAIAFGPAGTAVASAKAPLDYSSLGPGEESPFVVTVPVRGVVARFRVGFRSEDGSVVAHIDRRAADVSRAGL